MNNLKKVQAERRERRAAAGKRRISRFFGFVIGRLFGKFALAGKKQIIGDKKFSLALTRTELRLVSAAVLPCDNWNFKNTGTQIIRQNLKKTIRNKMIECAKPHNRILFK